MKFLAIAAVLFLLASCDNRETFGSGERLKQTRDDKTFTMTLELMPANTIEAHCKRLGVQYQANGCAAFNLETKHCTVYVAPQRFANDDERLAILGHEVWHCRFGVWHD